MKFNFFPEEDKHWYLFFSIALVLIAVCFLVFDRRIDRAFSIAGGITNLAGAYWIAAGVVLRARDIQQLDRTSNSGGVEYIGKDPNKMIIPKMFLVQSRRAQFGIVCILIGSIFQFIGAYLA